MLASGHIGEYLIKLRNLYKHSQQGWESFNSLLKLFFFRRTSKGGGCGVCSKLKPIARWLQRRLLFLCGLNESDLEEQNQPNLRHKIDEIEEDEHEEQDPMEDIEDFLMSLEVEPVTI